MPQVSTHSSSSSGMIGLVLSLLLGSSSALNLSSNQSSSLQVSSNHSSVLAPDNSPGWAAPFGDPDFVFVDPAKKAIYCYEVYSTPATYAEKLIGGDLMTGWQYVSTCMVKE